MQKAVYNYETGQTNIVTMTAEEQAEIVAGYFTQPTEPPAPTKEELLAQLNAIAAQIQALE